MGFLKNLPYWIVEDLLHTSLRNNAGRVASKKRLWITRLARRLGAKAASEDVRDQLGMWRYPDHEVNRLRDFGDAMLSVPIRPGRRSDPCLSGSHPSSVGGAPVQVHGVGPHRHRLAQHRDHSRFARHDVSSALRRSARTPVGASGSRAVWNTERPSDPIRTGTRRQCRGANDLTSREAAEPSFPFGIPAYLAIIGPRTENDMSDGSGAEARL